MLQLLSSLLSSMWSHEGEFQGLQFPEGFVRDGYLQDLIFVSKSLLQTGKSVYNDAAIIKIRARKNGRPFSSLMGSGAA